MYVIQRTAFGDKVSYWGRFESWLPAPELTRYAEVLGTKVIPAAAARFERWQVAFEVAEALRLASVEYGEVIAVIPIQDAAAAPGRSGSTA